MLERVLPVNRLVYSANGGGKSFDYRLSTEREKNERYDDRTYKAAFDLARMLHDAYEVEFASLLEEGYYSVSPKMRQFLAQKGMDQPRIKVYDTSEFAEIAQKYRQRGHYLYDTAPDSVVVNFQLPKPLDVFWYKHSTEKEIASWGGMYEYLAGVPWRVIDSWEEQHGDLFETRRINPPAEHENGDDGFYYLFEVVPRSDADVGQYMDTGATDGETEHAVNLLRRYAGRLPRGSRDEY